MRQYLHGKVNAVLVPIVLLPENSVYRKMLVYLLQVHSFDWETYTIFRLIATSISFDGIFRLCLMNPCTRTNRRESA